MDLDGFLLVYLTAIQDLLMWIIFHTRLVLLTVRERASPAEWTNCTAVEILNKLSMYCEILS